MALPKLQAYVILTGLTTVASPATSFLSASLACEMQVDYTFAGEYELYTFLFIEYICGRIVEELFLQVDINIWLNPR